MAEVRRMWMRYTHAQKWHLVGERKQVDGFLVCVPLCGAEKPGRDWRAIVVFRPSEPCKRCLASLGEPVVVSDDG